MSDELTSGDLLLPSDWVPAGLGEKQGQSIYSIDSILPENDRRFLKIRETFVHLTESPVRAGVLEVALFELARKLRGPGYEGNPVEWREEQTRILMGPKPQSCDLWAPLPNELLAERFKGFAAERSIIRAVVWLTDRGYLFRKRLGGNRNDRLVLVNVKQLEYDQGNLEEFADVKFKPSVSGSPEAVIAEPVEEYFASLYNGLVDIVQRASGTDGPSACRAALVLRLVLAFAEKNDLEGSRIARPWSVRTLNASFPWGSKDVWGRALNQLVHSGLVRMEKASPANLYEPNLDRIHAFTGENIAPEVIVPNQDTHSAKPGQASCQTRTEVVPNQDTGTAKPGQDHVLKGTEIRSEILPDLLQERERDLAGGPVDSLPSVEISGNRKIFFQRAGAPAQVAGATLTDLAGSDPVKAAALKSITVDLAGGDVPAVAFFGAAAASQLLAAMTVGSLIDMTPNMRGFRWIAVPHFETVLSRGLGDKTLERAKEEAAQTTDPLVIQGVEHAHRKDVLRVLRAAIMGRIGRAPIIFAELSPDLRELAARGEAGVALAKEIFEVLQVETGEERVRRLLS